MKRLWWKLSINEYIAYHEIYQHRDWIVDFAQSLSHAFGLSSYWYKKGYANQRKLVWNIIQKVSNYGTDLDIDISSRKYYLAQCTNIYWKIYQRFLRKQNETEKVLEGNHFIQRGRKLKRISRSTISCAIYKNMVRKEIWVFFLPSICCWRFRGTFIGLCILKHSLATIFTKFFRGLTLSFNFIKNNISWIQKDVGWIP